MHGLGLGFWMRSDVMLRIWYDGGVDSSRQKLTVDVINVTNDKINDLS